ncbi:hypothetical protein LTR62_006703 [Meristemomyces frigidus]|uniref:CsbD-like domain-containing protein n=1 Tax=Meristemomyces frigidus TaxID=1508187 RepID=A0AAN7TIJ6_9PEZI|nr:hypothetical protein LTR62_006703 [Meristemomyces frigidus]
MSDKNTSTLQSYIDSATGAAQSVLGSITGSTADKAQGENKKDVAEAKNEASHAGTTLGGLSISSSGVAANNPDRQTGSWNQTAGSAKESLGNLVGAEGLKREGQQQNAEGKAQEASGQLSDLGNGIADRVSGSVGGAVAGLMGDGTEVERQQVKHDQGKTLQRGVESEVDRKAGAQ